MPKVTVIIPNYNHALYLKQRIDSVINQTYQDFELIILDDCSTDNSKEIIEQYRNHPKVFDIIYNTQNSGSAFKQWKKCFGLSRGKYVWIAESDDYSDPLFLERTVKKIETDSGIGIVYCQSLRINENNTIIGNWKFHTDPLDEDLWKADFQYNGISFAQKYMLFCNVIPNVSAVLFNKEICTAVGGVDTSFKVDGDWMLYLKILSVSDVAFISDPLNRFREHSAKTSFKCMETFDNIKEYYMLVRKFRKIVNIEPDIMSSLLNYILTIWAKQQALSGKDILKYKILNVVPEAMRADPFIVFKVLKKIIIRL